MNIITEGQREELLKHARYARERSERAYGPMGSGADRADAPAWDGKANAFGEIAAGKPVEEAIEKQDRVWRAYAKEANEKVKNAPKTKRGPYQGASAIHWRAVQADYFSGSVIAGDIRYTANKILTAHAVPPAAPPPEPPKKKPVQETTAQFKARRSEKAATDRANRCKTPQISLFRAVRFRLITRETDQKAYDVAIDWQDDPQGIVKAGEKALKKKLLHQIEIDTGEAKTRTTTAANLKERFPFLPKCPPYTAEDFANAARQSPIPQKVKKR